jgi:hypothetical protein
MERKTHYHAETSNDVRETLEYLMHKDVRVRIWYGENGKSWDEENNVCGTIGRSTGTKPIPLLINNARSMGGPGLLDHCIVKIVRTLDGRVLYQHPQFSQSKFTVVLTKGNPKGYKAFVLRDRSVYARCKKTSAARRLAAFMNGERFCK